MPALPARPLTSSGPTSTPKSSAGLEERVPQVGMYGRLGNPEAATEPHGLELARVDEPVHRHLGDPHQGRDLGDGEEADAAEVTGDRSDAPRLELISHAITQSRSGLRSCRAQRQVLE